MSPLAFALTLVAALASGAMAGVFFAFSAFVMAGLGRLAAPDGVAAMQAINVTAVRPPLMIPFGGTAVLALGLAAWALASWSAARSALLLAGGGLYLVGIVAVTMARNVPLNDALAGVARQSASARAMWGRYLVRWTRWNHARAAAGIAAAGAYTAALVV